MSSFEENLSPGGAGRSLRSSWRFGPPHPARSAPPSPQGEGFRGGLVTS